jgi:hypothetical protein
MVFWLPQVEFAYNTSQALRIELTRFEANCDFSHNEEPPDSLLPMRPSISISTATQERLRQLREANELVTSMLRVHKDDMPTRSQPSTAP